MKKYKNRVLAWGITNTDGLVGNVAHVAFGREKEADAFAVYPNERVVRVEVQIVKPKRRAKK